MPIIKYSIHESGYVGAFGTATDKYVFMGNSLNATGVKAVSEALGTKCLLITVGMTDLGHCAVHRRIYLYVFLCDLHVMGNPLPYIPA